MKIMMDLVDQAEYALEKRKSVSFPSIALESPSSQRLRRLQIILCCFPGWKLEPIDEYRRERDTDEDLRESK